MTDHIKDVRMKRNIGIPFEIHLSRAFTRFDASKWIIKNYV